MLKSCSHTICRLLKALKCSQFAIAAHAFCDAICHNTTSGDDAYLLCLPLQRSAMTAIISPSISCPGLPDALHRPCLSKASATLMEACIQLPRSRFDCIAESERVRKCQTCLYVASAPLHLAQTPPLPQQDDRHQQSHHALHTAGVVTALKHTASNRHQQ